MKTAILKVIGMALLGVGMLAILCGFFAAIGATVSHSTSEQAYLIFASAGILMAGFLFLCGSKVCLNWGLKEVMDKLPPHCLVLLGYITRFLPRVKTWHKYAALVAVLFAAGLIWTNLLE